MFLWYLVSLFIYVVGRCSASRPGQSVKALSHPPASGGLEPREIAPVNSWPYQTFATEPDFHPPVLEISRMKNATPGLFSFVQIPFAPLGVRSSAPLIMTESGEIAWHGPKIVAASPRVQEFNGQKFLTYWSGVIVGDSIDSHGIGAVHFLNSEYKEIYTVGLDDRTFVAGDQKNNTAYPSYIDSHESEVTPKGTIIVTAFNATPCDLSSVGGPKHGWIFDNQFYEIDIKTNKTLFRWSSLEHIKEIPLNQSRFLQNGVPVYGHNATFPWNYFSINSVTQLDDGYVVSSRMFSSIYAIGRDGSIKWHLRGDTGGDFELDEGAKFSWQHYVRPGYSSGDFVFLHMLNSANIEFDNGTNSTTGLTVFLDLSKRKAMAVSSLLNPKDIIYSNSQGTYQTLGDGHVFLAYGQNPTFKEFDQHGDVVMNIKFGVDSIVASYRAYLLQWSGHPITVPLVNATVKGANSTTVYMSWNGATPDVYDAWLVYTGDAIGSLGLAANVSRTGFETTATIGAADFVQLAAIKGAQVLSKSSVIPVSKP